MQFKNAALKTQCSFYSSAGPWNFAFNVKFYPPDPAQLTEDITRRVNHQSTFHYVFAHFILLLSGT